MNKEFALREQEFIELNKLMKLLGLVNTGGEAKMRIIGGEVQLNGTTELQIRKKLRVGDQVRVGQFSVSIIK